MIEKLHYHGNFLLTAHFKIPLNCTELFRGRSIRSNEGHGLVLTSVLCVYFSTLRSAELRRKTPLLAVIFIYFWSCDPYCFISTVCKQKNGLWTDRSGRWETTDSCFKAAAHLWRCVCVSRGVWTADGCCRVSTWVAATARLVPLHLLQTVLRAKKLIKLVRRVVLVAVATPRTFCYRWSFCRPLFCLIHILFYCSFHLNLFYILLFTSFFSFTLLHSFTVSLPLLIILFVVDFQEKSETKNKERSVYPFFISLYFYFFFHFQFVWTSSIYFLIFSSFCICPFGVFYLNELIHGLISVLIFILLSFFALFFVFLP